MNAIENLDQIARDCYGKHTVTLSFQTTIEVDGEPVKYCSLTVHPPNHRDFCIAHGEEIKVRIPYKRKIQSVYTCTRD